MGAIRGERTGKDEGGKANIPLRYAAHEENIHMHIIPLTKPKDSMPSHVRTPTLTHTEKTTHVHTHALSYSRHTILLRPASCAIPSLISQISAVLTLSSHHFWQSSSFPLSLLTLSFTPPPIPFFPMFLPKLAPSHCASITCVMDC